MNEIEEKAGLPATPGYRYAKHIGTQLYISGQVPHNKSGVIVAISNPYEQAQQCLANLELLLGCYHFGKSDIQHITIYVVGNRDNLSEAWKAVQHYFKGIVPPATLLGVTLLGHENQLVEIDATITKNCGRLVLMSG